MENFVGYPYSLQESKFIQTEGYTERMLQCTAGLLKARGGDEAYIFHLHPDNIHNNWQAVKDELTGVQERLKKQNPNTILEGFLVGAKARKDVEWPNPPNSKTRQQANNLLKFFQQTGVEFSAFLIQAKDIVSCFHYSLLEDEITLYVNSLELCKKPIKTLNGLYSKRLIGKNDKIELIGD